MRPQFCWTFPAHNGPRISEMLVHGWVVSGTKGSLSRLFYEASVLHGEQDLMCKLAVLAKPDPADDMGGQIKHYKNPPKEVKRFLDAKQAIHLPDIEDRNVVTQAQRKRKKIKVMNLPGTLGQAQDLTTLEYPDVKQNELSEDEAKIFAAIPAFMEGTNVSINFPFQATYAEFVYIFRKCRMSDDLAVQASVRTLRDTGFGEIVTPSRMACGISLTMVQTSCQKSSRTPIVRGLKMQKESVYVYLVILLWLT
jgi:hypothetical protein